MFLRWHVMLLTSVAVAFVLFKLFVFLLNGRYLVKVINSIRNPRAETVDDIRDGFKSIRAIRDSKLVENQAEIERTIDENKDLRNL